MRHSELLRSSRSRLEHLQIHGKVIIFTFSCCCVEAAKLCTAWNQTVLANCFWLNSLSSKEERGSLVVISDSQGLKYYGVVRMYQTVDLAMPKMFDMYTCIYVPLDVVHMQNKIHLDTTQCSSILLFTDDVNLYFLLLFISHMQLQSHISSFLR